MDLAVTTKQDVIKLLRHNSARIRAHGVRSLGLFGSFARDEQRPDSDIDFLVDFDPGEKTFDHFMELSFLLEDLLRRRVELVTREALSPHLGPHILTEVQDVALAS